MSRQTLLPQPATSLAGIFLLIAAIACSVWLQIKFRQVQNAAQTETLSQHSLQTQTDTLAADLIAFQQANSTLEAQLAGDGAELEKLQARLAELELRAEPDFEQLKEQAASRLQRERTEDTNQQAAMPAFRGTLEYLEKVRDLDFEIQSIREELRFGPFLDQLGIPEPRRSAILSALAEASVELSMLLLQSDGASAAKAAELMQRRNDLSPLTVLSSLLTEDERLALPELSNQLRYDGMHRTLTVEMSILLQLDLEIPALYTVADTYMDLMSEVTREYSAPGVNINPYHLREIPVVRAALQEILSPADMREAEKLLESRERLLESIVRSLPESQRQLPER